MIRFFHTRGHAYTLKPVQKARSGPAIGLMHYDRLLRARWLRRATYIFTDLDRLSYWDLELTSHLYLQMKNAGLPVWNNPAQVKNRFRLLRALYAAGLNDFNAYAVDELSPTIRFPVFLRKLQGHRKPVSDLLESRGQLDQAIAATVAAGTPPDNLLVVEYVGEPIRPGLYRKLAAFRIGHAIVPHISVHDTSWLVKYGQVGIAGEDLYRDELALLQANPYADHLRKVFDVAGIEYGRADFGFCKGRLQIYEINTNPALAAPGSHPSSIRMQSLQLVWTQYLEALKALDSPGGWPVHLADGPVQHHRAWKNLFVRTRKVH